MVKNVETQLQQIIAKLKELQPNLHGHVEFSSLYLEREFPNMSSIQRSTHLRRLEENLMIEKIGRSTICGFSRTTYKIINLEREVFQTRKPKGSNKTALNEYW